eukprot:1470137-Prymnesium_polylepis.1
MTCRARCFGGGYPQGSQRWVSAEARCFGGGYGYPQGSQRWVSAEWQSADVARWRGCSPSTGTQVTTNAAWCKTKKTATVVEPSLDFIC